MRRGDMAGEGSCGESLIPANPPRHLQHRPRGNLRGCLTRQGCGQTNFRKITLVGYGSEEWELEAGK